jgi:7-keto-8-aminopelargonate synthetase-like enzyme
MSADDDEHRSMRLVDYARGRFRRAGSRLLESYDPFFVAVDRLRAGLAAEGLQCLSFAHYDYLGMISHPRIRAAAAEALQAHGTSVSASRLVGGERGLHSELEVAIADFLGREAALVLISGYLTNVTVLGHIVGGRDLIVYDELCHNSIIAGIASSKAEAVQFPHNDLDTLDLLLTRIRGEFKRALIVAESLYSMDGDVVDLPRLIEIKRRHDCWLMIDEAHSLGVLGATGRGLCEHYGTDPREVDLLIGTLSKTFVSSGGFIAGAGEVIRWLKYTLPGFVYSVGISPVAAAAAREAVAVAASEPERVARLQMLSQFFVAEAHRRGLEIGSAIGRGVVPILFTNDADAIRVSIALAEAGIYVPPIVRIGVPKDKPRLRFFISAAHTTDDIVRTLDLVAAATASRVQRASRVTSAGGR